MNIACNDRQAFAGIDEDQKQVCVFFFEKDQKVFTSLIDFKNDDELEVAKTVLSFYQFLWFSNTPFEEIENLSKVDPSIVNNNMKVKILMN